MNLSDMLREKNPVLTRQTAPDCIELTSLGEELAALVEAYRSALAPQACDGSGYTAIEHSDLDGNYTGTEHVGCPGCCACARPMVEQIEAALVAKIGGKG